MNSLPVRIHGVHKPLRTYVWLGVAIFGAVCLVLVPALTAASAILILGAQLVLSWVCNAHVFRSGQMISTGRRRQVVQDKPAFLSVHVPAHNEPPHVLIATLASLHQQIDSPAHEVIVLVNNTHDPALWQPVENWCHTTGHPFRFLRRDGVTGAKAGALNMALDAADPATTHIVVVDADYQVVPDFLRVVKDEIDRTGADFIQFPQAYRHLTRATEGLSFELADYFNRHARAANLAQAMLLTGTLSVIRRNALIAVGGWPSHSGTEDAALGSNLIAAGYAGVFIDRIVGRGLMPLTLAGLHQQRNRWAAGNTQVLLYTLLRWLRPGAQITSKFHKALVASQLAAWLNFGAPACVILIIALLQLASGLATTGDDAPEIAISASLITFILIICGAICPLLWSGVAQTRLSVRWNALVSRLSMLPVSAAATLSGASPQRQLFRVTPKTIDAASGDSLTLSLSMTGIAAITVIATGALLDSGQAIIAGLCLLLPPLCAIASRRTLAAYANTVASQES
jgi:cellulose synthase/poly-beta-1,6-N-acetylglucosamine synthase-like glycosyltransferase